MDAGNSNIRGAYYLHGETGNSGWKIKRFTLFNLKRFVNNYYGPLAGVIHFLQIIFGLFSEFG